MENYILNRKVYIVYVRLFLMTKEVKLIFDDQEFRKLENMKEEAKINEECENWVDYILKLAGVRK